MTYQRGDTTTAYDIRREQNAWTDPWGDTHPAEVLHGTYTLTIDGPHRYDNGYGPVETVTATDADGRRYAKIVPIDYGGTTRWMPVGHDGRSLVASKPPRLMTPDGTPVLHDRAATVRSLLARQVETTAAAREVIGEAVHAIFGDDPYAGYFGWDWTYTPEREVVTIHPWTYGGPMDSEKQPLPIRFFSLFDLEQIIAGEFIPAPLRR